MKWTDSDLRAATPNTGDVRAAKLLFHEQTPNWGMNEEAWEQGYALVIARARLRERERCARVARRELVIFFNGIDDGAGKRCANWISRAIRRGK